MFNKTMAIFLTTLALFLNLTLFQTDYTTTTEPLPTQDAANDPPPPPPTGGERGGGFDPNSGGLDGY